MDRGVDILPFNALLAILDVALMNAMCRESILKGVIVKNALLGSDYALIPVEVHYLWFESLFPAGSAKNPKQACISSALTGR